jgi:hypothetical protein
MLPVKAATNEKCFPTGTVAACNVMLKGVTDHQNAFWRTIQSTLQGVKNRLVRLAIKPNVSTGQRARMGQRTG